MAMISISLVSVGTCATLTAADLSGPSFVLSDMLTLNYLKPSTAATPSLQPALTRRPQLPGAQSWSDFFVLPALDDRALTLGAQNNGEMGIPNPAVFVFGGFFLALAATAFRRRPRLY